MAKKAKRLLIIDDEKDICDFEKSYFEKKGFEAITANTATAGINMAKSKKPDVAIIDLHLSKGKSGLEVLQKLRELNPECKCIMVTWDKEKAKEAKESGAVGFVIKPNEIKDLENAVKKAAGVR
jgi:DNA-binding NtrC family response regulator